MQRPRRGTKRRAVCLQLSKGRESGRVPDTAPHTSSVLCCCCRAQVKDKAHALRARAASCAVMLQGACAGGCRAQRASVCLLCQH